MGVMAEKGEATPGARQSIEAGVGFWEGCDSAQENQGMDEHVGPETAWARRRP